MDQRLCQEEERGLLREIERIDDFRYEAEKKLERIEEEISEGKTKYQEWVEKEAKLREELKTYYGKLTLAEESVSQAEQDRNLFHSEIREKEKRGESIRSELDLLREKINRAKLEQSEIQFKINSLFEIVKERFNLNLSDIYSEYLDEAFSEMEIKDKLEHRKRLRERLGEVNLTAIQEHEALKERYSFITEQREDLIHSIDSLNTGIRKINRISLEKFQQTFEVS